MRKRMRLAALVAVGVLVVASSRAKAVSESELTERIDRGTEFLTALQQAPDEAIPEEILQDAKGLIIIRQYKAGFVLGAKGGFGIVMLKDADTGAWSPPAFIKLGEGSIGWQIGAQAVDAILVIMNQDGVDMLLETRFKIGADVSVAAGPVGRDAAAKVGPGTAILVYSRTKGLFAGASIEGGVLLVDEEANEAMYGRDGITAREILFEDAVAMPEAAEPLVEAIREAAADGD